MQLRMTFCVVLALTIACGKKAPPANTGPTTSDVSPDNITVVDSGLVESGPALSGTLTAERSAQLRAQIGGTITELPVEEGAAVRAGQLVAVIDTVAQAEAVRSARSQLTSATLSADVARRNYERSQNLHNAGAIADRDLELAHNQSVAADAALADAKSRVTSAERLLANATVHAPFAGIIAERPVHTGDVVQVGALLMTLVDPSSLELDAAIPADQAAVIKTGEKVEFNVTGSSGKSFSGHIARINPSVDPATRQVRIYVAVPNPGRALATGAFAEGRVASSSVRGITIPLAALDTRAAVTSVKRIRNGVVESVPVTVGVRDDVAERVQVTSGVAAGDTLLIGGVMALPAGATVRVLRANQ